jgi:hypothetical protein
MVSTASERVLVGWVTPFSGFITSLVLTRASVVVRTEASASSLAPR